MRVHTEFGYAIIDEVIVSRLHKWLYYRVCCSLQCLFALKFITITMEALTINLKDLLVSSVHALEF